MMNPGADLGADMAEGPRPFIFQTDLGWEYPCEFS
jgi:hypothetical protein